MDKVPFDVYDFFAFLSAGFLLLLGLDYSFNLGWFLHRTPGSVEWLFWVVAAYVTGHINAEGSGWLLERHLITRIGYPSRNLFQEHPRKIHLMKEYMKPLPKWTAVAVREKFERMTKHGAVGDDFFLFCFHHVKEQCPVGYARLQTFQNLYGFSRNVCFAGIIVTLFLLGGRLHALEAIPVFLASVVMLFRYLKFFRHYSAEVFLSFWSGVREEAIHTSLGASQCAGVSPSIPR